MKDFSQTLKVARRQSGFSQQDCAHLLDTSNSRISKLEAGTARPSIEELCTTALIFGRTLEGLCSDVMQQEAARVKDRLFDLPERPTAWLKRFNRSNRLDQLAARIDHIIEAYGG